MEASTQAIRKFGFKKRVHPEFYKYIKHKGLVFLFLPGLIYYLLFQYGPMYGLLIAFKDYKIQPGNSREPLDRTQQF